MMNFTTSYNPSSCTFKFRTDTGSWEDITSSIIATADDIWTYTKPGEWKIEEENNKMNEVLKLETENGGNLAIANRIIENDEKRVDLSIFNYGSHLLENDLLTGIKGV